MKAASGCVDGNAPRDNDCTNLFIVLRNTVNYCVHHVSKSRSSDEWPTTLVATSPEVASVFQLLLYYVEFR